MLIQTYKPKSEHNRQPYTKESVMMGIVDRSCIHFLKIGN